LQRRTLDMALGRQRSGAGKLPPAAPALALQALSLVLTAGELRNCCIVAPAVASGYRAASGSRPCFCWIFARARSSTLSCGLAATAA
jgi:hypothetical protein